MPKIAEFILHNAACAFVFFREGNFKAAVCFHVQFPQFFFAVNVKLIVYYCRLKTAAYKVTAQGFCNYFFTFFFCCVFYQNAHKVSIADYDGKVIVAESS